MYAHPFCEEMNKARRMAALQSRRLAALGYSVLQIDLFGCGDSSGDFADAREIWKRPQIALDWLRPKVPCRRFGIEARRHSGRGRGSRPRLGLSASGNCRQRRVVSPTWLRLAAEMLAEGAARSGVKDPRAIRSKRESPKSWVLSPPTGLKSTHPPCRSGPVGQARALSGSFRDARSEGLSRVRACAAGVAIEGTGGAGGVRLGRTLLVHDRDQRVRGAARGDREQPRRRVLKAS